MNPLFFLLSVADVANVYSSDMDIAEIENPDVVHIAGIQLHCSIIPSISGSNTFKAGVKPRYFDDLESTLKNQAAKFFKLTHQENPILIDQCFRKLERNDPSKIRFFRQLEDDYESEEGFLSSIFSKPAIKTASWLLDNFGYSEKARNLKFKSYPEYLKNAIIYHNIFKPFFEAYHQFHVLKSQDSEILVRGIITDNISIAEFQNGILEERQIYITSLEIKTDSYEIRAETTANVIRKCLADPYADKNTIDTLNAAYTSFITAIDRILVNSKSETQALPYKMFRSAVTKAVINFVNNPLETSSVNIYGVFCPVAYDADEYFYLNKEEIQKTIQILKNSQEKKASSTSNIIILILIVLIFSTAFYVKQISSTLCKFMILFGVILVGYYLFCKPSDKDPLSFTFSENFINVIDKIVSLFGFNINREANMLMNMKSKEKFRRQGKMIMEAMLEDAISQPQNTFLLKIGGSNKEGFTLEGMFIFPDQYILPESNSSYIYPLDYNMF